MHAHLWFPLVKAPYHDGFGIRPTLLHPDSRGEVLLRSADPRDPLRIRYNFFTAPNDLPTLRKGFKRARDVAYQRPLDPYRGVETSPGAAVKSDAEIDAWIARTAITAHHPCGTCADGHRRRRGARSAAARCAASSGCAWSTPRRCPISSPPTSTPAC